MRDNDNNDNTVLVYYSGPPGQYDHHWDAGDGPNLRWHGTRARNFFSGSPFNYTGMNYQMHGFINAGPHINAYADGRDIYFGSEYGLNYAHSSDVVYHEYTHNVIYRIYGGWIGFPVWCSEGYAMDEGISDYFAATMNDHPVFANDLSEHPALPRYLDNDLQWEECIPNISGGPYRNGAVIGGAMWRTRQAIGNSTIGNNLAFKALQMTPRARDFSAYLYNVYIVNDNQYGGQYFLQIKNSFAHHDITTTPPPLPVYIDGPSWVEQCGNYTSFVTAGSGDFSYEWYENDLYIGSSSGVMVCPEGQHSILRLEVTDNLHDRFGITQRYIIKGEEGEEPMVTDLYYEVDQPTEYNIYENYPNPFNPITNISYSIPEHSRVSLIIYDIMGREVRRLVDGIVQLGYHTAVWDGTGNSGTTVSSGIYIYRFTAVPANDSSHEGITTVRKMVFTK